MCYFGKVKNIAHYRDVVLIHSSSLYYFMYYCVTLLEILGATVCMKYTYFMANLNRISLMSLYRRLFLNGHNLVLQQQFLYLFSCYNGNLTYGSLFDYLCYRDISF